MLEAPFGTWISPIEANMVASQSVSFQDLVIDNQDIYWSEMRPNEKGRYVIVQYNSPDDIKDILPPPFSARTRVHEYGGNAFTVKNGIVYFINDSDQCIYMLKQNDTPERITKPGTYFANMQLTPYGIIAIAELHAPDLKEPQNFIAKIDPNNGNIETLYSGHDFYSQLSISEDNQHIAWIAWNHPNMPWDNNELWQAKLDQQGISNPTRIDADHSDQSFFQPQWDISNQLITVSDKSDWWNLYQIKDNQILPIFKVDSEIGLPLWVFNMSTWAPYQDSLICLFSDEGKTKLWQFRDSMLTHIDLPYTQLSQLRTNQRNLFMIAGNPDKPSDIISVDTNFNFHIVKTSNTLSLDTGYISKPQHIAFPTSANRTAYGYYYPPQNKKYKGLSGTLPPLIVKSHGGPTASASTNLNLQIQYWTSRGFAFVDVNYAGSTGYGRSFRKSLEGKWGVYDVDDCVAAANHLIKAKKVDEQKIAITGSSAGGYTTLAALTFTDRFKVGASYYGVSDLAVLVQDTHKFESKYLDRLVGTYPEEKNIYHARSPIHHIEKLSNPVIFFQGAQDKIVPPNQAEKMYQALKLKGVKTKYCLFEEEQHGFRDAKNIIASLNEQLQFFIETLNLEN